MATVVGGLRARFIKDSVFSYVRDKLGDLHWLDQTGRQHSPVTFVDEPQNVTEKIESNTLALSTENTGETDLELGSALSEFRWPMWLDFFAESEAVGIHLVGDVAAILAGRMASIGAHRRAIPVYDFAQATPAVLFVVQIENVRTEKAHDWPHQWLKHWHSCSFDIVDEYTDEGALTWDDLGGRTWDDLGGESWEELG